MTKMPFLLLLLSFGCDVYDESLLDVARPHLDSSAAGATAAGSEAVDSGSVLVDATQPVLDTSVVNKPDTTVAGSFEEAGTGGVVELAGADAGTEHGGAGGASGYGGAAGEDPWNPNPGTSCADPLLTDCGPKVAGKGGSGAGGSTVIDFDPWN